MQKTSKAQFVSFDSEWVKMVQGTTFCMIVADDILTHIQMLPSGRKLVFERVDENEFLQTGKAV